MPPGTVGNKQRNKNNPYFERPRHLLPVCSNKRKNTCSHKNSPNGNDDADGSFLGIFFSFFSAGRAKTFLDSFNGLSLAEQFFIDFLLLPSPCQRSFYVFNKFRVSHSSHLLSIL